LETRHSFVSVFFKVFIIPPYPSTFHSCIWGQLVKTPPEHFFPMPGAFPPEYIPSIPPNMFSQCEGCSRRRRESSPVTARGPPPSRGRQETRPSRRLSSFPPEHFIPMRGVLSAKAGIHPLSFSMYHPGLFTS
jgi:hypothetical protein